MIPSGGPSWAAPGVGFFWVTRECGDFMLQTKFGEAVKIPEEYVQGCHAGNDIKLDLCFSEARCTFTGKNLHKTGFCKVIYNQATSNLINRRQRGKKGAMNFQGIEGSPKKKARGPLAIENCVRQAIEDGNPPTG